MPSTQLLPEHSFIGKDFIITSKSFCSLGLICRPLGFLILMMLSNLSNSSFITLIACEFLLMLFSPMLVVVTPPAQFNYTGGVSGRDTLLHTENHHNFAYI